ncbi:YdeI/OmpD-associated family protein [Streptococcus plurextorum]|uniref:YdeI/OmpD-associated family protein n=1 Tax=Streptococcus plurextorum TaxID=456876 RepID=UPI000407B849|nr:YdeI/OmpD-associated family protein [Streptococcus plurextorum]
MDRLLLQKLKLDTFSDLAMIRPAKEAQTAFDGFDFPSPLALKLQLAIAYVYSLEEMKDVIVQCSDKEVLVENGQLYLLYPKMKNKLGHPPIHRDAIFPYLEVDDEDGYVKASDYKFNRMLALDDNYTLVALKYQPKRRVKGTMRSSARVNDYLDRIKDIEAFLAAYPEQLAFYQGLTPGYQKDWARHVYSAKTEVTISKRLEEMVRILSEGYKTKQHYREGKKYSL